MKKISYIICLTAILCSCNNELPIENVQELQTPKSKEDSEILSFKNSEEFLSTIENFDLDNPILTRASSSFVSAENIYKRYSWNLRRLHPKSPKRSMKGNRSNRKRKVCETVSGNIPKIHHRKYAIHRKVLSPITP